MGKLNVLFQNKNATNQWNIIPQDPKLNDGLFVQGVSQTESKIQTSQADFEAVDSGGFGYSTASTPGSVVGNDDLGVYRSAPFDLGLKTKLATATITKGGSARVLARSGSVASVSPVEVKRTSQAELGAGSGSGWMATVGKVLRPSEANGEISSSESGLVDLWHMNNDWLDAKGTNHGTRYGSGTPFETTSPKLGAASGKFNGTSDYIGIGDNPSLDVKSGDFSITYWFKRYSSATNNERTIYKGGLTDTNIGYSMWCGNTYISVGLSNGTTRLDTNTVHSGVNNWSYVAVVMKRDGQMSIYMNGMFGSSVDISSFSGLNIDSTHNLRIGSAVNSLYFTGLIDEVAIYNRALSAAEIQQHYEAGSPAISSTYESDTLELISSAQGDRLAIQADVPTNTTLSYKIKSGETVIPDGSWSAWTTPASVITGLNIFNLSALTGKYWQIGFDGTSNGSATWTMGGFAVVPKADGYGSLIEIVNPIDIQGLAAERYLQYLALGVNSWNVDAVGLGFLRAYADLGVLCKLSGAKVKMLAGSPDVIDMVASPENSATYSALDYSLFSQLSPIVRTGDDFEVVLVTPGRWVIISFTGEITELEVYHRLADGLSLLTDAGGTELSSSGIGDEKVYSLTLPNGIIGGSPSSPVEIRFTAPIKDIGTSGLWSLLGGSGINNIEVSLNGMDWYTSAQLKVGVGLGGALQGAVKSFFLRINPDGGTLGSKQVSLKKFITVGE